MTGPPHPVFVFEPIIGKEMWPQGQGIQRPNMSSKLSSSAMSFELAKPQIPYLYLKQERKK